MVPVLRSCQSPIWIWLVNYLHLPLHSCTGLTGPPMQPLSCRSPHLPHISPTGFVPQPLKNPQECPGMPGTPFLFHACDCAAGVCCVRDTGGDADWASPLSVSDTSMDAALKCSSSDDAAARWYGRCCGRRRRAASARHRRRQGHERLTSAP